MELRWGILIKQLEKEDGGRCLLCGSSQNIEVHHIVNRARTAYAPEARIYSEVPELVALLCNDCHSDAVHTPQGRERLFNRKIDIYGREKVQAARDRVNDCMKTELDVDLPPEREEINE
jgi:5-methylcytosine-specific restriction endonuclease McrA